MCAPKRVALGDSVELRVELVSSAASAQDLAIDYVVHHVKASGATSPKVFKGWVRTLGPREALTLVKRHAVRPITTRRYFSGRHRVELQVNGAVVAEGAFDLRVVT